MAETIVADYITAKTVKVEVIRLADSFRYDWADATFKTSGWTTRQKTLTEDATTTGLYTTTVNPRPWTDGDYTFVLTASDITTRPLAARVVHIVGGELNQVQPLLDRFALEASAKVTNDGANMKVLRPDATILRTIPVSDDATTETLGPGA